MITVLSLSPCIDKVYFVEDFKPDFLYRVTDMVKTAGGRINPPPRGDLIPDGNAGPTACSYKLFNTTGGFHFNYLHIQT